MKRDASSHSSNSDKSAMGLRFVSLIALVSFFACSTPEDRLAEHLENGARFGEQDLIDEAILEYRSALRISPMNAEVNERLADQLAKSKNSDAALYYRDAFRLDPERIDAAIKAARLLMPTDLSAATNLINDALSKSPENPLVYVAKSELALARNDSNGALAAARKARALDPKGAASWYQLGRVYQARLREDTLRKRDSDLNFNLARKTYQTAKGLAPESIRLRIELARVYGSRLTHRRQAREELEEAMALAKEIGDWRDQLAVAQAAVEYSEDIRNPKFSLWALRGVVAITPDDLTAWRRLAQLRDSVKADSGLAVMKELITKRPDDPAAQLVYARYLISRGREGMALSHLSELLESGLDAPEFWEQITRIKISRGKVANARATYVEMLDHYPDHRVSRQTDARIAIAEGRYGAASETLRSLAAELDTRHLQFLLARSEFGLGNLPNAAAAVERALPKTGVPSADLTRLKAQIHFAAGEWDLVVKTYVQNGEILSDLRPAETLMLAQCLYRTHRAPRGRELLEQLFDDPAPFPPAAAEYALQEGKREPQKAYQYLTAAHERDPFEPSVLGALMKFDRAAGREQLAMDRLDRAVETRRAPPTVLLLRGRALVRAGEYAKAERDVLLALESDPNLAGAIDLLFSIYQRQGTLLSAQASFEEAEAAGLLHAGAQQLLARIYRHHGDTVHAREILEKVETDHPKMFGAKADLAALLAESDTDLDRALELAEEVQQHRSVDARAADAVGYVYLRKGLNEAAVQQFRYAIELEKNRDRAAASRRQYHLGLALRGMNRNIEASQAFEKALQIDPEFESAEDARSQLEAARSPNQRTSGRQ